MSIPKLKKFVADVLVKPFLSISFFIVFGAGFILIGYQTINITGKKDLNEQVVLNYTNEYFWGILRFSYHIYGVKYAEIKKQKLQNFAKLNSTVMLVGNNEEKSLLKINSNFNLNIKQNIVEKINSYIADSNRRSFKQHFKIINMLYWIGLIFFVIGILALFGWPKTIIDGIKKYRKFY